MPDVTPLHAADPRRVGRYRLTGIIAGLPAAGPAYLARSTDGGHVSVTLLGSDWTSNGAARDRFIAEARAARRVAPFCAARILDAGFDDGEAYLVREYIPGPSLSEAIEAEGTLRGAGLAALALGTATGLAAIHHAGLVHGEFDADHIVLGPDGPRVVEFGITPPYGAATPAADMLAWARTVLRAAAGEPADAAALDLLAEPLRTVAARCLSAPATDRPSARAVVGELLGDEEPPAGLLAEGARQAARAAAHTAPAPPPGPARQPGPRRRRSVTFWWAAGVVACIAAIAVAIHVAQGQGGRPAGRKSAAAGRETGSSGTTAARRASGQVPATAMVPGALTGSWSGQVRQRNPAFAYNVRITLTAGTRGGTIRYSGATFSCSGSLSLVSSASGRLTLNQAITSHRSSCANGVVTLVGGPHGTVDFTFRGQQGPPAVGSLTRP